MLSLLFGAGFSKWAINLPVGKELFDFTITPWKTEQKKLKKVKLLKKAWDDSNPRGLAEQFISHALTLEEADRRAVLWYVVRRLSVPFVWEEYHSGRMRRHILMID